MDVSPNVLRKETVDTLKQINTQIEELKFIANGYGIRVEIISDTAGNSLLTPLLLGKAQCLNTLVLLRENKES